MDHMSGNNNSTHNNITNEMDQMNSMEKSYEGINFKGQMEEMNQMGGRMGPGPMGQMNQMGGPIGPSPMGPVRQMGGGGGGGGGPMGPVNQMGGSGPVSPMGQMNQMQNEGGEQQAYNSTVDTHELEQEEINSRSIFVGNVDYSTQPEELQNLFSECGIINRVTILVNKNTGHSKGYAYIEFADQSSVRTALSLSESFFKRRQIKVCSKRRNIPGFNRQKMSPFRGRGMKGVFSGRGRLRPTGFRPFYRGRGFYKKVISNPYERT